MKPVFALFIFSLISSSKPTQELANSNNLFTLDFYKEISKTQPGNFLVSPFSAEVLLALTQSGAKGETAEELRNALHLPNDKTKIESSIKELLPKFKDNGKYTLNTANKIYIKREFEIKREFKNAAVEVYGADAETIDFVQREEAAKVMNDWVEKKTNNRIKNLINSNDLNNRTKSVLVNTLYFQSKWEHPFFPTATSKISFYKSEIEKIEVDALHQYEEFFNYFECPHLSAKFLELPFEGGDASMTIVLPNEKSGISNLENNLDRVFGSKHNLESEYLNVVLPKFKIETSTDLKKILKNLGITKAFVKEEADFSGIAGRKGELVIDQARQKTFIDVNEQGVEAGAATFVAIATPDMGVHATPKNFVADHAFIFYIKVKDVIIFAGRVLDPSKN